MTRGHRTPLANYAGHSAGRWQSGELLECIGTHDELADVRSYFFCDPAEGIFHFRPGQHIALCLPIDDTDHFRTFSVVSSPTRNEILQITVKTNRPDGATGWMRDNVVAGVRLRAYGPTGRFNVLDNPADKLMLVSAGSGITPMLSMLRWLHDRNESTHIVFLHYARSPQHFLFCDELAEMERAMANLTVLQIPSTVPKRTRSYAVTGRISEQNFSAFDNLNAYTVFCCGPQKFMDRAREILAAETGGVEKFISESFSTQAEKNTGKADLMPANDKSSDKFPLSVVLDEQAMDACVGELLLDTLRRAKIPIPTGCREGRCGTCRLRLVEGKVLMNQKGGLSQKEEAADVILACCTTIQSDVSLLRC